MGLISGLIFGAVAGWVASILTGRNKQQGIIMDVLVGIAGAFIGSYGYTQLTGASLVSGWNLPNFIVSVIGAVALLFVLGLIFGGKKGRRRKR